MPVLMSKNEQGEWEQVGLNVDAGGGGSSITVDSALSETSENPVQNKVITGALKEKLSKTDIDSSLSPNSTNPVQNKVIDTALKAHVNNKNNPHGVTAEQVGAAPAGFGGFGETIPYFGISNDADGKKFEAMLDAELAKMKSNTAKQINWSDYPYFSGSNYTGILRKYDDTNYAILTGTTYGNNKIKVIKDKFNGTWNDFKSEGNNMWPGNEFLTLNFRNSSGIYQRVIDFIRGPEAFFEVPHQIKNLGKVVKISANIHNPQTNTHYPLPYLKWEDSGITHMITLEGITDTHLQFRSQNSDLPSNTLWNVYLEYTKR